MDPYEILSSAEREKLPSPPDSTSYVDHVVKTALRGYPELAADSLLNPSLVGKIAGVIGGIARQLTLEFEKFKWLEDVSEEEKIVIRGRAYDVLLEIAINFFGMEREWVGFGEREIEESLRIIRNTLAGWENIEREESGVARVANAVVKLKIEDMKKVMASNPKRVGMVAWLGEKIESRIDRNRVTLSFLDAVREEIQSNVYYTMSREGMCRFGNDYAIGLRWLRRLGFVQVSTNPQLAAIAYKDDPSLWDRFKDFLRTHRELLEEPEKHADELAMAATELALWPNMEVFRPVALLKNFDDGMVSYQLNPNVADSLEGSLRDALKIYSHATEYFSKYDEYLLWGWPATVERGRPNIVFKVAGSSTAAVDITRELESLGIGTNNTVTFTVAQEAKLILAKMEGRAKAVKRGIKPSKVYETNMGGRLEGHLRERFAASLIKEALKKFEDKLGALTELANGLGLDVREDQEVWRAPTGWGWDMSARSLEEKVELVSMRQYLRPLTKEPFAEFLAKAGMGGDSKEEVLRYLAEWEEAIGLAGTLVAQRVWWIFFSPENRGKWIAYLISEYGLEPEEAEVVLDNIDVLPASKRKPMDTYLTLARRNMTNTEFPNHQLSVVETATKPGFDLRRYDNAILMRHEPRIVEKLMQLEDFRRAYELTPDLAKLLERVGIDASAFGTGGIRDEDWKSFGSTVKTMNGFTQAYNEFRSRCVQVAREVASEMR